MSGLIHLQFHVQYLCPFFFYQTESKMANKSTDDFSYSYDVPEVYVPPPPCIPYSSTELNGLDADFYRYVIPTITAVGMTLHVAFWFLSCFRRVPTLCLYTRLLLALSFMDVVQLACRMMQAARFIQSKFTFLLFESGRFHLIMARFPFVLQLFSSFFAVLIVIWICLNCSHDFDVYSAGTTGSLLRAFNDQTCLKSLTAICVISLCLTSIMQIQSKDVKGPRCFLTKDGESKQLSYMVSSGTFYTTVTIVIRDVLFVLFTFIVLLQFVIILRKMRAQFAKAAKYTSCQQDSGGEIHERQTLNDQPTRSDGGPNQIRLATFFLVLPMCLFYIICWMPLCMVNLINSITSTYGESKIKGLLTIWMLDVMRLLTSVFNPCLFLLVTWKYYRGVAASASADHMPTRSRRETQETNV